MIVVIVYNIMTFPWELQELQGKKLPIVIYMITSTVKLLILLRIVMKWALENHVQKTLIDIAGRLNITERGDGVLGRILTFYGDLLCWDDS